MDSYALRVPFVMPDLTSPLGNAMYLIAKADHVMKDAGVPRESRRIMIEDMMSEDYDHLLDCLFKYFIVIEQAREYRPLTREELRDR